MAKHHFDGSNPQPAWHQLVGQNVYYYSDNLDSIIEGEISEVCYRGAGCRVEVTSYDDPDGMPNSEYFYPDKPGDSMFKPLFFSRSEAEAATAAIPAQASQLAAQGEPARTIAYRLGVLPQTVRKILKSQGVADSGRRDG